MIEDTVSVLKAFPHLQSKLAIRISKIKRHLIAVGAILLTEGTIW